MTRPTYSAASRASLCLLALALFSLLPALSQASGAVRSAWAQDDPEPVEVLIRVENESGLGLIEAVVEVTQTNRPQAGQRRAYGILTTNEAGEAKLTAAPGAALTVSARHADSDLAFETLVVPRDGAAAEIVLRLRTRHDRRLQYRLVDDITGAPVAGATVTAVEFSKRTEMATTGADGRFDFQARSWEDTHYVIAHPGHARTAVFPGSREWPEGEVELRLRRAEPRQFQLLHDTDSLDVEVRLAVRGLLPPAQVKASRESHFYCVTTLPFDVERHDGRDVYLVRDAPEGARLIVVASERKGARPLLNALLTPDLGPAPVFDLSTTGAAEGVAQSLGGTPLEGIQVWIARAPAQWQALSGVRTPLPLNIIESQAAGDAGAFRFDGLPSGPYVVGIEAEPGRVAHDVAFEVDASQGATDVTLNVVDALTIQGTLRDRTGKPVSGRVLASMAGAGTGADRWAVALTDPATGAWEIGPLAPGLYTLIADDTPDLNVSRLRSGKAPITHVQAGRQRIELALQDRGSATVTVVDESGRLTRAHVVLLAGGRGAATALHARPSARVRALHQPTGEHMIFAATDDGRISDVAPLTIASAVQPGRAKLVLRQGATLSVRCEREQLPVTVDVASKLGHRILRVITRPGVVPITVPAGELTVRVTRAGEPPSQEGITASPGAALSR